MALFDKKLHKAAVEAVDGGSMVSDKLKSFGVKWTPAGLVGPDGALLTEAQRAMYDAAPDPVRKVVVVRHESGRADHADPKGAAGEGIFNALGHRLHDMILEDKPIGEK
jgi:hypothetical protein